MYRGSMYGPTHTSVKRWQLELEVDTHCCIWASGAYRASYVRQCTQQERKKWQHHQQQKDRASSRCSSRESSTAKKKKKKKTDIYYPRHTTLFCPGAVGVAIHTQQQHIIRLLGGVYNRPTQTLSLGVCM